MVKSTSVTKQSTAVSKQSATITADTSILGKQSFETTPKINFTNIVEIKNQPSSSTNFNYNYEKNLDLPLPYTDAASISSLNNGPTENDNFHKNSFLNRNDQSASGYKLSLFNAVPGQSNFANLNLPPPLPQQFQPCANATLPDTRDSRALGFSLINLNVMDSFINQLACPDCTANALHLFENKSKRKSAAQYLSAICSDCGKSISFITSPRVDGTDSRHPFEVNVRLVTTSKNVGLGFTNLTDFCSGMNLPPPMHLKTFQKIQDKVHDSSVSVCDDICKHASKIIRDMYVEMNVNNKDKGVIDIVVSFDGTWMKRGHTSHFGIGIVIELLTGLALDFAVMSNYCHACAIGPPKNDENYDIWWGEHKSKCSKNMSGSSGSMESESAKILWNRSVEKFGFCYRALLSDGDSKTFKQLQDHQHLFLGYEGCVLIKEECVNHVEKRMGTALRQLVDECKAQKTPIHGRGRLTKEVIDNLTRYYGWAIKSNSGNLEGMYNAIWATLFHVSSSDEKPCHTRCPQGKESWCHYNRAIANNELPPPHKPLITNDVGEKLVKIYKRLSSYDLLSRCLEGKTQNPNECLNSIIWRKCLKISFASLSSVETAAAMAVASFNKGAEHMIDIYAKLKITENEYTKMAALKKNSRRILDADRKHTKASQYRRIQLRTADKRKQDESEETEGVVYAPGTF